MTRARLLFSSLALAALAACEPSDPATAPLRTMPSRVSPTVNVLSVANTNDDGAGSLRKAVADAQAGDVIQFASGIAGQTIVLTTGQLTIDKQLTIEGSPTLGMTISGGDASRIATITSTGDLTIRNLTITGGLAPDGSNGGAFRNTGKLTIEYSTLTGNRVEWSGAGAEGGAIYNASTGTLKVVNSTISGNTAASSGGGIASQGALTLTHVTMADNVSQGAYGGAFDAQDGSLKITNSIFANNSAGNTAGFDDCRVLTNTTTIAGALIKTSDCLTGNGVAIADPLLGPLANNGGPTKTHAILLNSPAIDVLLTCVVADDQRHVARPQGSACDYGAYEFTEYLKTPITLDGSVAVNPDNGVAIVTGTLSCTSPIDIPLHVELSQAQKSGRATVTATGSGNIVVSCATKKAWSISLKPPTGAFTAGTGTVAANTTAPNKSVAPASATGTVKLYWARR